MISRTASKLGTVCYNGRTGKSFSVAALAARASKTEIEISEANRSDEKQIKKGKGIPKDQRRVLVQEFVKRYKATNDGKIPSTKNVIKEVGGSYNTIKILLQEVENQLTMPAFNQSGLVKETVDKEGHLSKAEVAAEREILSNSIAQSDAQMAMNNRADIDSASRQDMEAERVLQYSAMDNSTEEIGSRVSSLAVTACDNGRTGNVFSVDAFTVSPSSIEDEIEISEANRSVEKQIKKGKKIPRAQRRALIEEFVKKYKAMNGGKIPATENVKKEVGGSYYTVKILLQEVKAQLKMPAFNKNDLAKETINKEGHSSKAEVATESKVLSNSCVQSDALMAVNNNADKEVERVSQYSAAKNSTEQGDYSEFNTAQSSLEGQENVAHSSCKKPEMSRADDIASDIGTPTNLLKEDSETRAEGDTLGLVSKENTFSRTDTRRVSVPGLDNTEDNKQKEADSEDLRNKDSSEGKTGQREETPNHQHSAEASSRQTDEAEGDKKPTLWANLKSFADGIMNIWRKS